MEAERLRGPAFGQAELGAGGEEREAPAERLVGDEPGLDGGDKMSVTTFIQRVSTVGGVAPSTDCAPLGAKLFVPYETDYVFYRAD